jgi:ABC-type Fe3+ transport system substrate-binding protein
MSAGHRHVAAALVCTIGLIGWGSSARAQSVDELYEKAKGEKELIIYGGGPAAMYEVPAREFERRFPGIKVSIESAFSNVLDAKIDAQIAARKLEADLAILQTVQDFIRWKKQGVLGTFKPDGWDSIDQTFKDPDGNYVGVFVTAVAYAYNPSLVTPAQVPRSALDFLKPEFHGKIIACYPHDDDVTLYQFYSIVRRYGWDYMDRYMANGASFVQGHLGVARSISAGESFVSPDSNPNLTLREQRAGKPAAVAFSDIDPTPVWAQTAATFKDSPHPNAARLYLTWFLSREQQSKLDTWSARVDVAPPQGLDPLFSHVLANKYAAFISDEALVSDLRKRFETLTGPVRKTGGVR